MWHNVSFTGAAGETDFVAFYNRTALFLCTSDATVWNYLLSVGSGGASPWRQPGRFPGHQGRKAGQNPPPPLLSPLTSLCLFFPCLSLFPLGVGLGERCKLPQRGLGGSPTRNRFWCVLTLKSDIWCQQIKWFPKNQINKFHAEFPIFAEVGHARK